MDVAQVLKQCWLCDDMFYGKIKRVLVGRLIGPYY